MGQLLGLRRDYLFVVFWLVAAVFSEHRREAFLVPLPFCSLVVVCLFQITFTVHGGCGRGIALLLLVWSCSGGGCLGHRCF